MKLYDFSFKTGSGLANLASPRKDTCFEDYYFSNLILTSDQISGIHSSLLSYNGQTLLEQTAISANVPLSDYYFNSGDYHFKTGSTYLAVSFNENVETINGQKSSFFYNLKENLIEPAMGTGSSPQIKQTGLRNQLQARFPSRTGTSTGLSSFDYFANGQKIYSGSVSGSYRISGSPALFYYDDSYSGKIFAIPKNTGIKNQTGLIADIYGQKYVEKTVFGYCNGMSLHKKNWLELSTGVILVTTGLQASIFDVVVDSEIIQL